MLILLLLAVVCSGSLLNLSKPWFCYLYKGDESVLHRVAMRIKRGNLHKALSALQDIVSD